MEVKNSNLKYKIQNIPKLPGVYQFLNKDGGVIYVGKAKNLRSRVGQYFGSHDSRPQLPYLMREAADINYTVVNNELESLFLENTLIKQYLPKYNISLRDDKNYAFIKISYSTQIPQIGYARKIDGKSNVKGQLSNVTKYFGPYSSAHKIRDTLHTIRKIFPYCASEKIGSRPCFYYYLHRCPGVCIGKITLDEYKLQLEKIVKFLQGDMDGVTGEIKKEMQRAAKNKKYETAARLRDQLRGLEILRERQNVILPKKVDWDLVSLATQSGYACINLFKIRGGKMFDKENFVYEIKYESSDVYGQEIIQRFLEQYYLETSSSPKCVYIQLPARDSELISHIIFSRFGKKSDVINPQKGKPRDLVKLGQANAGEYLKKWLSDKAGNLDKINNALLKLKETLNLPRIPKRIECYDISNTQGTNAVGSMVVFIEGLPAKSQYRKFKIKTKQTPDDFAMMKEMLSRRLRRIKNKELGIMEKTAWPLPDLIVIDGGKGQLGAVSSVIQNSKFKIPAIGLAKRIEEIFLPGKPEPIILPRDNPGLQLLQRLRDEAHRFGITFHRSLRSRQAVKSALDDISGIGPKTKKLLKQRFGTVFEIKKADAEELAKVVGKKLARTIKQNL